MPPDLKKLPPIAAQRLREYYRRKRLYGFLRVILSAGSAYLLLALIVMHLDRFLFLDTATRALLSGIVHGTGIVYALLLTGLFVVRRISTRRLAYELESRLPRDVSERYVTLATLQSDAGDDGARSDVYRALVDQLVRETIDYSESFLGGRLVSDRRFRILGLVTAAMLSLYALLLIPASYQFTLMMQRFATPHANLPKPGFVRLQVTPESAVIGRGGEIVIQARTEGEIPQALVWFYRLIGIEPGDCRITIIAADAPAAGQTLAMSRIQRTLFIHSAIDLQNSFTFSIRSADAETARYQVDVVAQPQITQTLVTLTPPAYTRLPDVTHTNVADPLAIYPGTAVALRFTVDQPVVQQTVTLPRDETAVPDWDADTRTGSYRFEFREPFDLEIGVVNDRGFANTMPVRIPFRAREDQRPTVRLDYPSADFTAVPGELIPLQFKVEDDLGVEEVFVQYLLNPDEADGRTPSEFAVDIDPSANPRELELSYMLDLDTTGAVPGDQVLFLVRARDGGGNDGESRPVIIHISAFARGENERHRLDVLTFIGEALERMAGASAETTGSDAGTVEAAIRELAADRGIPLETGPLLQALVLLMEQEHHFTDHPLHKTDMRRLTGLVRAAGLREDAARRGDALRAASAMIPELTANRRLKNVVWRYFGLSYELAAIRERMQQTETQRKTAEGRLYAILTTHATALVAAARGDRELGELTARRSRLEEDIEAKHKELIRAREGDSPLPAGMGGMGMGMPAQQGSPETRRISNEITDLRSTITRTTAEMQARGRQIAAPLLGRDDSEFMRAYIDSDVIRTLQAVVALTAVEEPDMPAGELVAEAVKTHIPIIATPPGEAQSINRRAQLYLRSAEDIGSALTGIPGEAATVFDPDGLRGMQGNLNAAIHRITRTRDSLTLRIAASLDVHERLLGIVRLLAGELPAFAGREILARQALQAAFDDATHGVLRVRSNDRQPGTAWLQADMRMMGLNPFADLGPFVHAIALIENRPDGNLQLQERLAEAGLPPPPAVAPYGYLLAVESAYDQLLRNPRVDAAEQHLGLRLKLLEAALVSGAANPTNTVSQWHQSVAAFDPASLPPSLPESIRPLLTAMPPLESVADGPHPLHLDLLDRQILPNVQNGLRTTVRNLRTSTIMFETTQSAISVENEDMPVQFTRLLNNIEADLFSLEAFELRLRLRLAWLPPDRVSTADALLFLRLREAVGRYRVRSARNISTIDALTRRSLNAADVTEAGNALRGLTATYLALRSALESLGEPADAGDAVAEARYPLLATFARTALQRELSEAIAGSDTPAEISRTYLEAFPHAADIYIAGFESRLTDARTGLSEAIAGLEAEPFHAAAFDAVLTTTLQAIDTFADAMAAVRGETADRLHAEASELRNRIAAQQIGSSPVTEPALRQRLFVLTETLDRIGQLRARLDTGPADTREAPSVYSGGPENIWIRENRLHAEVSRNRLSAQAALADQRIATGLLSGLRADHANADRYRDAQRWSGFLYRLVRSPLTGDVRTTVGPQVTREAVDPLTEWLLRQLDEARREANREGNLRYYRDPTREWIDSLRDFLRY